ncbi:MAG: glucose/arabinose dehydrogenase [Maribacter sp.]|jgi:glucose/arabinose dehydrogenase
MKKILLFPLFIILFSLQSQAQTTVTVGATTLTENIVATGLDIPWEILWGPDDHIWVTERTGEVKRINPENGNINTILDLSGVVYSSSEPGLLGMALHPDFENTPKVFLVYTYWQGNNRKEKLVAYDWDGMSLSNEAVVLDNITAAGIHNGSRLLFLPDNTLLMTTGDVGNNTNSPNLNSLNGKTLRLNMDGSIPADNPDPTKYYYTFGNRNAQGICIAPNGKVYTSEHGQNHSDEINVMEMGADYGWPEVEGPCNTSFEVNYCNTNNITEPIWAWTSYCIAPNDLVYYNHPAIPEWENSLLVSILGGISAQEPRVSVLTLNADGSEVTSEDEYFSNYGRIRDVCVNPNTGSIYFATNGPSYPSSGPNMIVEYSNEDFTSSNEPTLNIENQFVKVSPNPITSTGKLEFSDSFIGFMYDIISYNGQVVQTGKIDNTSIEISKKTLPTGAYYIKATNDKGTITQTIIMAN